MKRHHKKTALVTGASSGIGRSFAERLASDGYSLILTARSRERLMDIADGLSGNRDISIDVIPADLSIEKPLERLIRLVSSYESIDFLVHSAGFGTRTLYHETSPVKISGMVRLHALSGAMLSRALLPGMISRRSGTIILVSSLGAFFTTSRYVTYSATKSFLNTFATGLNGELGGTGVRVQALCPGLTKTGFLSTQEYAGFNYDAVPDWAWMSPDEVVEESLSSLRKGRTICIPGFRNRAFVGLLNAPVIGRLAGWTLAVVNRKKPVF
ncbi:MAG: SDR family oxidoreductase [Spirochaetes bacterium]|jgi:hypothetical protein|nr:SDR family oxidoreductase [Spirochaetota bacterium]